MFDDSVILDKEPEFSEETREKPNRIKIIGVGGGGNNAVNNMYRQKIDGVSFVVLNTDSQALKNSPVPNKLLIGPETAHGMGAGNKPDVARAAAEESSNEIAGLFDRDTEMVFITAGMGGGTGTGAAPVVARIAKEKGVLTVGIVTIPFLFEGERKILKALKGAEEMKQHVDALMIINNERLTEIYEDLTFVNAMCKADDTLTTAARSISEMITIDGYINIDMRDVDTTLRNGGVAIISTGYGEGEHRITKAITDALRSPLLKNRDVYKATRILLNFYFSPDEKNNALAMSEFNEVNQFMANFDNSVDVIWGAAFDNTLGETMKVSILAAGFDTSIKDDVKIGKPDNNSNAEDNTREKDNLEREKEAMIDIYGPDKIAQPSKGKYKLFKPDEMDDDEAIEAFATPTFKRDPKTLYTPTLAETPKPSRDGDGGGATAGKKITFG